MLVDVLINLRRNTASNLRLIETCCVCGIVKYMENPLPDGRGFVVVTDLFFEFDTLLHLCPLVAAN